MKRISLLCLLGIAVAGIIAASRPLFAAQLQLLLPLGRTAYQTNETIDISVVRSDTQTLPAGELTMTVTGDTSGKLAFTFPLAAVAVVNGQARTTEHLHLNGWLMRPDKYTVDLTANGGAAQAKIELYSHIRKSTFGLVHWGGGAKDTEQWRLGEDGLGFNQFWGQGNYSDYTIRAGMDYMRCCTMSGGHQMDLRSECDWSDPYVLGGGIARAVNEAFASRTRPNVLGVHFYDEPGLTWWTPKKTGQEVPHNLPSQDRSYKSAYGQDSIFYADVNAKNPADAERWAYLARWKESFMEAAWKHSRFGVEQVRPDYLSATQSVYGWLAFSDGYYFNVVRSLPMISGHGEYDMWGPGYLHTSFGFAMGRMRDLNKPYYYMPGWDAMPSERMRAEQYLSFIQNVQGMMVPPPHPIHNPAGTPSADGIVESNKTMGRLGTIFTTMPVTRPPVAVLYAMSQNIYLQENTIKDPNKAIRDSANYPSAQTGRLNTVYVATTMIQQPFFPIVEEDVLDGTLAANHKVLIVAATEYLDPQIISALETFIANGGTVLLGDEARIQIKGAKKIGARLDVGMKEVPTKDGKTTSIMDPTMLATLKRTIAPLAMALQARLQEAGIAPIFTCDNDSIVAGRQAAGDIEYLFAVNAKPAVPESYNAMAPTTATISLPADGRPIYDAVRGKAVVELQSDAKNNLLTGSFRFGAGEMRAFARTTHPIGGVRIATPVLFRDFTVAQNPIHVTIKATLVDQSNNVLSGSAPLRIRLIDPLGGVRYDLFRATDQGTCTVMLPLAVNDPSGSWKVEVQDLLAYTQGSVAFIYTAPAQCGALAGATRRAVLFGNDRENIFRFFHAHQDVTIVKGKSDYNTAAADRIAESLRPWGIRCSIVNAADVNKAKTIPAEALPTWAGLDAGRIDPNNYGVGQAGFAVNGPVILLGTPDDNPLIAFAQQHGFLPYKPDAATFPGIGRGYLAWQRDAVGYGQESITCIAYDATGLSEAVGTLYEAMAGLDPLMPLTPPKTASVQVGTKALAMVPTAKIAWQAVLPDHAVAMTTANNQCVIGTLDGSVSILNAAGKIIAQRAEKAPKEAPTPTLSDAIKKQLPSYRIVKKTAGGNGMMAVGYWGGLLQFYAEDGTLKAQQQLPQDISGLAWMNDILVVGLGDGRVLGLTVK